MELHNTRLAKQGFTLIELSLVLIIIGLLVTVFHSAQDMIRNAQIRSVAMDTERFRTAMHTFERKFGDLPGDIDNMESFFPTCIDDGINYCSGDGDGKIYPSATEGLRAWQHLSMSGMIQNSYSGILDANYQTAHSGLSDFLVPSAHAKQPKYDVCHKGKTTINVAKPSILNAHLAHGDTIGACDESGGEEDEEEQEEEEEIPEPEPEPSNEEGGGGEEAGEGGDEESGEENNGGDDNPVDDDDNAADSEDYDGKFTIGWNVPDSKIANAGYKLNWNNTHLLTFAAEQAPLLNGAVLSPLEAYSIDIKIDDGEPASGSVISDNGSNSSSCISDEGYNVIYDDVACQIHFVIGSKNLR